MRKTRLLLLLLAAVLALSMTGCAKLRSVREDMLARDREKQTEQAEEAAPDDAAAEDAAQTDGSGDKTGKQTQTESSPTPGDVSLYIPILQARYDPDSAYQPGTGILYDLDGDGTQELILTYTEDGPQTSGMRVFVRYTVYTIRDGAAVELMEPDLLFTLAGGNSGAAAVVRDKGQICLAAYSCCPEVDGYYHKEYGYWKIYEMHDGAFALRDDLEFEMAVYDDPGGSGRVAEDESRFLLNGQDASYSDYKALTGDFVYLAVSNGSNSFGFRDLDSTAIPDLIRSIERGDYTQTG